MPVQERPRGTGQQDDFSPPPLCHLHPCVLCSLCSVLSPWQQPCPCALCRWHRPSLSLEIAGLAGWLAQKGVGPCPGDMETLSQRYRHLTPRWSAPATASIRLPTLLFSLTDPHPTRLAPPLPAHSSAHWHLPSRFFLRALGSSSRRGTSDLY